VTKLPPELQTTLAATRKAFGLTQDELARAVKVSRQTVSSMEQGDYNPSASLALRLAALFDLSVEQLFSLPEAAKAELETERRRFLKTRPKEKLR
jgi:putative transcriptional regulator